MILFVVIFCFDFVSCCLHKSQSGESEVIHSRFFSAHSAGTFLEIGGYDGITYSNSYFFECLGWRGVLIEGNPQNYRQLIRNRPNTTNLQMAICRSPGTLPFTVNGGAIAGVVKSMPDSFLRRWHGTLMPHTVDVYCGPLAHQLCLLGIHKIDFFSLDVEGAEFDVLSTIDFTRVSIHVVIVEADEHNTTKNTVVRNFMAAHGFSVDTTTVSRSDLFVNKHWPAPLPPHVAMPCHSYRFDEIASE